MAHKIKYEILYLQVEKLYDKEFSSSDIDGINNHCDYIQSFIESCGWSIDDYIRSMMGFTKPNSN